MITRLPRPTCGIFGAAFLDDWEDDELDHVDMAAREETLALLKEYAAALKALDFDALSRANQVDAALLLHELQSGIWNIETLQEWAWNPLYYVSISGSGIYGLLSRDFAPLEDRLGSAASRLEQLPRFFEQARAALDPARVPAVHAETAVQQNPGLNSIIDNMIVPHLDVLGATERARMDAAIETARKTGGNLTEIFEKISATIRERLRIETRIRTLTAELNAKRSELDSLLEAQAQEIEDGKVRLAAARSAAEKAARKAAGDADLFASLEYRKLIEERDIAQAVYEREQRRTALVRRVREAKQAELEADIRRLESASAAQPACRPASR